MTEKERVTEELYRYAYAQLDEIRSDKKAYANGWTRVIVGIIWLNRSTFEGIIRKYFPNNNFNWEIEGDDTYNIPITGETTGEQIYSQLNLISTNHAVYNNDILQILLRYTELYDTDMGSSYLAYIQASLRGELRKRNSALYYVELAHLPWIYDDITEMGLDMGEVPPGKKRLSSVLRYAQAMKKQLTNEQEVNNISEYDFLMKKKAKLRNYTPSQIDDIYEYYISYRSIASIDDQLVANSKNTIVIEGRGVSDDTYEVVFMYIDHFIENDCDEIQRMIMMSYMDKSPISTSKSLDKITYRDYYISRYDKNCCKDLDEIAAYLTQTMNVKYDSAGVKRIYSRCIQKLRYMLPK